jgi:thioesterase domain-containing protein
MQHEGAHQQPDEEVGASPDTPVEKASRRPIVFVLPGLGGEADPDLETFYRPMRAELDLVPITYLDWVELVDADCEFGSVAANVRRQIESKMPNGPIRLAGYSIGGHLAYVTARVLRAEGRAVEVVAILDAPADVEDFVPSFGERLRERLERLLAFDVRASLASLFAKLLLKGNSRRALGYLARYRRRKLPFRFDVYLHHTITMQLVLRIFPIWWQKQSEQPTILDTPTYLFRAEDSGPIEREDLGWSRYCSQLKVSNVAGSHRGMLHPSINARLRAAFTAAMLSTNS